MTLLSLQADNWKIIFSGSQNDTFCHKESIMVDFNESHVMSLDMIVKY